MCLQFHLRQFRCLSALALDFQDISGLLALYISPVFRSLSPVSLFWCVRCLCRSATSRCNLDPLLLLISTWSCRFRCSPVSVRVCGNFIIFFTQCRAMDVEAMNDLLETHFDIIFYVRCTWMCVGSRVRLCVHTRSQQEQTKEVQ